MSIKSGMAPGCLRNHSQITRKIIVSLDPSAPKIELLGDPEVTHEAGTDYVDAGVKVLDAEGLVIADAEFSAVGLPDGKALGSFTVSYGYEDSEGRIASAITRKVIVVDTTPPLISVLGEKTLTFQLVLSIQILALQRQTASKVN